MEIIFLGHASFRLRGRKTTLITDPFDPAVVGLKFPKTSADIVTISHDHADHNQSNLVSGVKRVVNGPGEYEISGISIIGISTFHDDKNGELRGKNTLYVIEVDGLRIAHLGDLGHGLSGKLQEKMGQIDVLIIPTGGEYTIGPKKAAEVARDIEAPVTIPMHYQTTGLNPATFSKLASVDVFAGAMGIQVERLPKLSLRKEILEGPQRLVVLEKR